MRMPRKRHFILVDLFVKDIAGQIDVDRSRLAAGRDAKGLVDDLGDPSSVDYPLGEFGDRPEHPDLVHLLKGAHTVLGDRAGAAEGDYWNGVEVGVADPRYQVGGARTRR